MKSAMVISAVITVTAEHDDGDPGEALVDEVGDGDICGDNRDARAHVQHAHEFEGRGARIDEHGVAIAHQLKGGARDGLLGIDIHVDALILDRNGQGLVQ